MANPEPSAPQWRLSWWKRTQVAIISSVGFPVLAALGATYRIEIRGLAHEAAARQVGPPVYAFWHGRILPAAIHFRHRGIVVIVSENFDGEWIARIAARFGYGAARGSSSRGGPKALRQMVRDVREAPVAFTVDGPRGPARVAQPGAVWLSKASGHPLLPFHMEAERHWTVRSWDRAQVPKPFTRIALAFAPPVLVPRDIDADGLERHRLALERALAACEAECRAMLAADGAEPHAATDDADDTGRR